jgi:hypothetical protein
MNTIPMLAQLTEAMRMLLIPAMIVMIAVAFIIVVPVLIANKHNAIRAAYGSDLPMVEEACRTLGIPTHGRGDPKTKRLAENAQGYGFIVAAARN